uniref:N-glycosylase/DNA lyase n=1 Tax=Ignisphaera aggregans TaxID=334771 RepID=A0A7C2Z909_9CREN
MISIDHLRIDKVAKAFKELGIERVKVFEDIDPQLEAVKYAVNRCGNRYTDYAFYVNALLAYRLKMKGEVFWDLFAKHLVDHCEEFEDLYHVIEFIERFTKEFNTLAQLQKIKRLHRIRTCSKLYNLLGKGNYAELAKKTAICVGSPLHAKTVVFSVKMLYYTHKAVGKESLLPFEIPIPVDRRIAFITYTSAIVRTDMASPKNAVAMLMRNSHIVRDAWNIVASASSIPPLHIDSVLWYFGKFSHVKDIREVIENIDGRLYALLGKDILVNLANELFYILNL